MSKFFCQLFKNSDLKDARICASDLLATLHADITVLID